MSSRGLATTLLATALLAAGALAPAGAAAVPAATPLAVDLEKVPVGTWAEYQVEAGDRPAKSRWALVARAPGSVTIEMSMEAGPLAQKDGKLITRLVIAPDPRNTREPLQKVALQIEGQAPIEVSPASTGPQRRFKRPDPKSLVGKETIKVIAGNFTTSHYREPAPDGAGTIDVWVSDEAPPLGLVKMTITGAGPTVTTELTGRGKDAKPALGVKAPPP